ncbi:MAG: bifunctional riboflavin kinase/FAD synthetase [Acidobacteria bacterium]|nr:bifunctional riboflavin kinase/FAD synthetase [Acidobacteriota bacterium]
MAETVQIYRTLEQAPPDFGPSALTIGNFDGVHAGHRRILRRLREVATDRDLKPSVLTFDPHPTKVVAPQRAPRLMTTPEQRCRLMAEEGIRQVLILPFTEELAQLSPEEFVKSILVRRLGVKAVLVGDNFRFGHSHSGNVETLRALGGRYGFSTEIIPALTIRGGVVSSSTLRTLIEAGKVSRAIRLLERPYALEGAVVPGHGIGSKKTVPTLNLRTPSEVLPKTGVYVTCTTDLETGVRRQSITNVGYRPTFDGDPNISIETHLLDALEGPTPREIRVEFLWRLRDERKFESPEALKAQILRDVARARAYFAHGGGALWTSQPSAQQ